MPEQAASQVDWAGRFEDLRRRVTEGVGCLPREPGLAVFVRQGLAAWMQVWPELAARSSAPPTAPESARLPAALYGEVTRLLVDMIIHQRQEMLT